MPRSILDEAHIHPSIAEKIADHHIDTVREVQAAVFEHDLVVVGMAQNPYVKTARQALQARGLTFKYCEYGSYFGGWRRRSALKMWTGWPTLPMIFVKGVLIGGASELKKLIADDQLTRLLARNDVPAST